MSMRWNRVAGLRKIGLVAGIMALGIAPASTAQADDTGNCALRTGSGLLPLRDGKTHTCTCPAGFKQGPVFGTQIYSVWSDMCADAVHAGIIKADTGGIVTFKIIDSPDAFKGSTQNGITSMDWKKENGAIQFVPAGQ